MTQVTITFDAAMGEANVNDVTYQVAYCSIPNRSLVEIFNYGLQRIVNDKCGGKSKTAAGKAKIANATIERILAGTLKVRTGAKAKANPLQSYIRDLMREMLDADQAKAYKDLDSKERLTYLDSLYAELPDDDAEQIEGFAIDAKAMADAAKERQAAFAAKMGKKLSLADLVK